MKNLYLRKTDNYLAVVETTNIYNFETLSMISVYRNECTIKVYENKADFYDDISFDYSHDYEEIEAIETDIVEKFKPILNNL